MIQPYVVIQNVLIVLNGFYPQPVTLEQIKYAPFFEKLSVTEAEIQRALDELAGAGYIVDTAVGTPLLGNWYKLSHAGVMQITRRALPDPMVWGKAALT